MKRLFLEDFTEERVFHFGKYLVSESDAKKFEQVFDPKIPTLSANTGQPDVISGWFVCAVTQRLLAEHLVKEVACRLSPGFTNLRFQRGVSIGDILSVRVKISRSSPREELKRGQMRLEVETLNEQEATVISYTQNVFVESRGGEKD